MFAERVKFFAKDVLYFGLGNMLYSLVQFISMPLVVKSMDKNQVANWNILLPTGVLLSAIVTFGMDSAVVRFVKDAETAEQKKKIFSTGFFFETGLALLVVICLTLFASPVQQLVHLPETYSSSWLVMMGWLPGIIIAQYFQNWFKYTFRRSLFILLIGIQSAVYLGGIVYLKATSNINLLNVMWVMLASQWVIVIVGFLHCKGMFTFSFDKKLLQKLIFYGLPFMIMAFGYNFISTVDRYILPGKISDEEFAVYTQTFRITAILSMVVSSFNFAFGPFSLSILGKSDAADTFSRFHTYYLMIMCFAGLSFLAIGKPVVQFFAGSDYIAGSKFMVFFVVAYVFYGLYSFAQLGIIHSTKSFLNLYTLLAGMAVILITDNSLVSSIKGYGTALGFMMANIAMVLLANFFSKKYLPVKYNLVKDTLLVIFLSLGGWALNTFEMSQNVYNDALFKLIMVIILFIPLLLIILKPSEKQFIRKIIFR
ncbi:MAG: oligosaccharide flippase family protein [Chitinophagaceae bacterium]